MNAPPSAEAPPSRAAPRGPSTTHLVAALVIGLLVFLGVGKPLGLWKALFTVPEAAAAGVAAALVMMFASDLRSGIRALVVTILIGVAVGAASSYLW